ncbi:hypothetical protein [Bacillus sp. PS06]|uniref:hypothetical protein n=1 Tax=Bacillus sp. PS06 TaxID=2764176 RepID=UPI0017800F98|nr:hypothetical protein [Bacillus sp. PS06]MBD8071092.1 hypothetical protein [Bacillus sp. PS06]
MKKYIGVVLLVLIIELAVLFGIHLYFDTNLLSTLFFGSIIFSFFAFITGSRGDALSKQSELAAFDSQAGAYKPKHEALTLRVGPFLIGSLLCFIVYLILEILM